VGEGGLEISMSSSLENERELPSFLLMKRKEERKAPILQFSERRGGQEGKEKSKVT